MVGAGTLAGAVHAWSTRGASDSAEEYMHHSETKASVTASIPSPARQTAPPRVAVRRARDHAHARARVGTAASLLR